MHRYTILAILVIIWIPVSLKAQTTNGDSHDASRWADAISAFEKSDIQNPPPKNAILFVGSSSIRKWDLASSFPELVTINRGFGGSQMADTVFYVDAVVLKHQPKSVVVYAGDNDLEKGKTPERIFADFAEFVAVLSMKLPHARIHFIAIKPSIERWNLIEEVRFTNQLIEAYCQNHDRLNFVDICSPMLTSEGQPDPELFAEDGLHLSKTGYEIWSKKVMESLESEVPEATP